MKNIEVGEYVRTNRRIGQILEVKTVQPKMYGQHDIAYKIDICPRMYITKTNILKHSKNIIDLIEVGDIVHTRDVLNEDIVYIWSEEYLKALKEDLKSGIELVDILTHEQYEQNCYKVSNDKTQ